MKSLEALRAARTKIAQPPFDDEDALLVRQLTVAAGTIQIAPKHVVDRIVADLIDRSGLRGAWESIDERVREQIRADWRRLVEAEL